MKLLVGLGNPGKRYARQRHNVGFMAIDAIIARQAFGPIKKRFKSETADGKLGHHRVLAIKPQTFMNESGRAVGEAARYLKIDSSDIIVIHDEIDLAAGKVKVKTGGGNAGHNGLKSITSHVGADFTRVRIGIGHPGDKSKVHGHVLGDFSKADGEWLSSLLDKIGDHAGLLADGDGPQFSNALSGNTKTASEPSPRAAPVQNRRKSAARSTGAGDGKSAPSQRDLARNAAGSKRALKNKSAPKEKSDTPVAAPKHSDQHGEKSASPFEMLRRFFGGSHSSDQD